MAKKQFNFYQIKLLYILKCVIFTLLSFFAKLLAHINKIPIPTVLSLGFTWKVKTWL